jgi:hypothetical protein
MRRELSHTRRDDNSRNSFATATATTATAERGYIDDSDSEGSDDGDDDDDDDDEEVEISLNNHHNLQSINSFHSKSTSEGFAKLSIEPRSSHKKSKLIDKFNLKAAKSTVKAATNSVGEVLNRHFASSSAVRDFNEAMPVVVLPSNFIPQKGHVIKSDPSRRLNGDGDDL